MRVIKRKPLLDFGKKHPTIKTGLDHWYRTIKLSSYRTFNALRKTFKTADQVGKYTVFNIGGNKARLIVAIHYNTQRVYARHILTHEKYDEGKWKE
ncbi:type II toxin-antitoxin system HigB family toxin [Candidatus Omnitrophota bacterium]